MGRKQVVTPVPGQGIPAVVDPNPARTASDNAEAQSDAQALQDGIAAKQANEQAHSDQVQQSAQNQIDQANSVEAAADLAAETNESDLELIEELMDQLGVDELHENSKQEYFTSLNLAINSEGGKKHRVKTHNRESLNTL